MTALTPFQSQISQAVSTLQNQVAQLQSALSSAGTSSGGGLQTMPTSLITPFCYLVQAANIAALGNQTVTLQLASDSAFELLRLLGYSSADTPSNYFQSNFSALIIDQSTGRQLANQAIPQQCLTTNAMQFGNDEKYPILFPAQGILQIQFTNLTNATLTASLVLRGYKIFQTSPG